MDMYPIYKAFIKDENVNFVHTMSVVSEPATEEEFIFLKRETDGINMEFAVTEDEKRMVIGPAMVPNKLIFRNTEKYGKIYVKFDEPTIEQAAQLFFKDFKQGNINLEHMTSAKNMTIVESWIIEDSEKDKAAALGFNLPPGTWMISMKVENDEVWEDIKDGKFRGFSIEAAFRFQPEDEMVEMLKEIESILLEVGMLADDDSYEWHLGGGEPCPACVKWSEMGPRKGNFWMENAIPGVSGNFPHGPYGTFCEDRCKCSLVKVF